MAFDYEAAISEGYSDQEIADHLSQASPFDVSGAIDEGYSYKEIAQHLSEFKAPEAPAVPEAPITAEEPERTVLGTLGDIGLSTAKGVIAGPEALIGLVDIPKGGRVGKFLEETIGYRPKEAREALDPFFSEAHKAALAKMQAAEGIKEKAKAAVTHPSLIGHAVVESLPAMGMGGAIAKGLGAATGIAPWLAGALGEGAISAGATASDIRQTTGDLTKAQSVAAAKSGLGTTVFGIAGSRLARKLGVVDVDTLLAGGKAVATKAVGKGIAAKAADVVKRIVKGGISEGVFEELPQSIQEQIWSNAALGKPLTEGLDEATIMSIATGGVMGAGANILSSPTAPAEVTPPGGAVDPITGQPAGISESDRQTLDAIDIEMRSDDPESLSVEEVEAIKDNPNFAHLSDEIDMMVEKYSDEQTVAGMSGLEQEVVVGGVADVITGMGEEAAQFEDFLNIEKGGTAQAEMDAIEDDILRQRGDLTDDLTTPEGRQAAIDRAEMVEEKDNERTIVAQSLRDIADKTGLTGLQRNAFIKERLDTYDAQQAEQAEQAPAQPEAPVQEAQTSEAAKQLVRKYKDDYGDEALAMLKFDRDGLKTNTRFDRSKEEPTYNQAVSSMEKPAPTPITPETIEREQVAESIQKGEFVPEGTLKKYPDLIPEGQSLLEKAPVAAAPAEKAETAQVKTMITAKDKNDLANLGYPKDVRKKMKPQEAADIIANKIKYEAPKIEAAPAPVEEEATQEKPAKGATTSETVRTALGKKIKEKSVAALEKAGRLKIVQSQGELVDILNRVEGRNIKLSETGTVEGVYDPESGTAYLVADNLESGDHAWQILRHELGVHAGLKGLLGARYNAVMSEVERLVKQKNTAMLKARQRALDDETITDPDDLTEETLAYWMNDPASKKTNLYKRIVAAIKSWAKTLRIPGSSLSEADFSALVDSSIGREVGKAKKAVIIKPGDKGYSRARTTTAKASNNILLSYTKKKVEAAIQGKAMSPEAVKIAEGINKFAALDKELTKELALNATAWQKKPGSKKILGPISKRTGEVGKYGLTKDMRPSWYNIQVAFKTNPELKKKAIALGKEYGGTLFDKNGDFISHPIELRTKKAKKDISEKAWTELPKFGGFRRSMTQTYLDNMYADREAIRKGINSYIETIHKTGDRADLLQISLKKIGETPYSIPSAVRSADKTVAAVNLNSMCPMFMIGAHGCYFDGCYVTGALGSGPTGTNFYGSAMYLGEILQLSDDAVATLNKAGGLRMNGAGDTVMDQLPQWQDIFKHAQMRGLKLKVISKQDSTFAIIDAIIKSKDKLAAKKAREIVVQPTVDPYWVPATEDDYKGAAAALYGSTAAKERKSKILNDELIKFYKASGRDAKIIKGEVYRKYGFSWDQINELSKKYPDVKVQPRLVVGTYKEIADYALKTPEILQTWMHAAIRPGMFSEIEGRVLGLRDTGMKKLKGKSEIGNFDARVAVQKIDGEWHILAQVKRGLLTTKTKELYTELENYIKDNYTKVQADKIFGTLAGQIGKDPSALCCSISATVDECLSCTSSCHQGTYYTGNKLRGISERGAGAAVKFSKAEIEKGQQESSRSESESAESNAGFKLRTDPAPRETRTVYKAFRKIDGKLYPMFVGSSGKSIAKVVPLPEGKWIDAQGGGYSFIAANGRQYTPTYNARGGSSVKLDPKDTKVKKELVDREYIASEKTGAVTAVVYRPGWHAGYLPFFPQGGTKDKDAPHGMRHEKDTVIAEVEIDADQNFQQEYEATAERTKKGTINHALSGIRRVPKGGYYDYSTNPLFRAKPELGGWLISGSAKINRILQREEIADILQAKDVEPQLWEEGAPLRFSKAPPVESKAFKEWFGDSKVVDADGKPLVVYHGSVAKDIAVFDVVQKKNFNTVGDIDGIYFTPDKDTAANYAVTNVFVGGKVDRSIKKERGKVYPVYLNISNPLNITKDIIAGRKKKMTFGDAKRAALKKFNPIVHDGVIFNENAYNSPEYIVFHPAQIKSATGNIGTFDPADPRIKFSKVDISQADEPITSKDYEDVIKSDSGSIRSRTTTGLKDLMEDIKDGLDKFLGALSTRLKNIDPGLKKKLRKLSFDTDMSARKDAAKILPMLKKAKRKMTKKDFAQWDYARKNSDIEKINELVGKYKLEKEYKAYRQVIDSIRKKGLDVGLEIGFIEEYAPRLLVNSKGFLRAIGKDKEWPTISKRLKERALELGIEVEKMTQDQRADLISGMIYGGSYGLGGVSATKARKLAKIPAELNKYYADSDTAMLGHIYSMHKAIEARKFFGKIPKKVSEMRVQLHATQARIRAANKNMGGVLTPAQKKELTRLKGRAKAGNATKAQLSRIKFLNSIKTDTMPDELVDKIRKQRNRMIGLEKQYQAYIDKYAAQRDYTANIGVFVDELIERKKKEGKPLTGRQEQQLLEMLNARFEDKGTHGLWNLYKNFAYIDTMGSPISAVTQIGDLAWAAYEGGTITALKHAGKSLVGKARIKKADLGLDRVGQEFADPGKLGKAVETVFKMTGLSKMDAIGKEALLNSALDRYQREAKKNPDKLRKELEPIFEGETEQVIQDLLNDEVTENVEYLLYSRLLDFQPMALSEMPEVYLKSGNGRIFYMLKSFTLKQFDVFRNEAYQKIKSDDPAVKKEGLKNLVKLAMFFVIANGAADEIKDFILGRPTDLSDRLWDNVLRLFGISKFVTWKARTEGLPSALAKQVLPPFKFADSLYKDVVSLGDEKGLEVYGSLPIFGKIAYWRFGRGAHKRGDLWDRRLSKEKSKLAKVEEGLEQASDKGKYKRQHRAELTALRKLKKLQSRATALRKRINTLKSKPDNAKNRTLIINLEKRRTTLITTYFKGK